MPDYPAIISNLAVLFKHFLVNLGYMVYMGFDGSMVTFSDNSVGYMFFFLEGRGYSLGLLSAERAPKTTSLSVEGPIVRRVQTAKVCD